MKAGTRFRFDMNKYAMFIALIAITLLFQVLTGGVLLKPINISNLIQQNSYILILAIGMLPVILTGNIDLSVGSIVAVVGAVTGVLIINLQVNFVLAIVLALVIGALIGAFQGFWVAYVRVPAFIVTLAGMLIFRGLTMVILQGSTLAPFPSGYQTIAAGFLPNVPGVEGIHATSILIGVAAAVLTVFLLLRGRTQQKKYGLASSNSWLFILQLAVIVAAIMVFTCWIAQYKGIPAVMVLLTILIVIYSFITNRVVLGRHIYALGGNEKATQLSGVNTKKVKFLVFVNMGILAAVAGVVFSGRLNCASPAAGDGFELDAIAACYIGGASASGGVGTIMGAIVGGLVMGVLNNGMSIMGLGIDWQQAIKGMVLLLAVAFDIYNQSRKK